MTVPLFINQLTKEYKNQLKAMQIFKIVASMGIFGNVGTNLGNIKRVVDSYNQDTSAAGTVKWVFRFIREIGKSSVDGVGSFLGALKTSAYMLLPRRQEVRDIA